MQKQAPSSHHIGKRGRRGVSGSLWAGSSLSHRDGNKAQKKPWEPGWLSVGHWSSLRCSLLLRPLPAPWALSACSPRLSTQELPGVAHIPHTSNLPLPQGGAGQVAVSQGFTTWLLSCGLESQGIGPTQQGGRGGRQMSDTHCGGEGRPVSSGTCGKTLGGR